MTPSEWAKSKIDSLSVHVPVFWVEDPYGLLEKGDLTALAAKAEKRGRALITASSAFRLREQLLPRDPSGGGVIVVDQSCTPREPHLLPRDCKPHDFAPLAAPDWKTFLGPDALFRPTIRDFLIACTDDRRWPAEVNLYPYETLARQCRMLLKSGAEMDRVRRRAYLQFKDRYPMTKCLRKVIST